MSAPAKMDKPATAARPKRARCHTPGGQLLGNQSSREAQRTAALILEVLAGGPRSSIRRIPADVAGICNGASHAHGAITLTRFGIAQTERVTVISGTFHIGMGDKFDAKATDVMNAGAYGFWGAGMKHFVWCKGETILQFHGDGP